MQIFFLTLFFLTTNLFAQEKCLSGQPNQKHLIQQLKQAKANSPIAKLVSEKYNLADDSVGKNLTKKTEADSNCTDCEKKKNTYQDISQILKEKTFFKPECLVAATRVETSSREISCPNSKIAKFNFCFTKTMIEYQNAVFSELYKCVKKTTSFPITPEGLFKMYTLESGFKPAYVNDGGTGLGQLTGIFIKDLHQKHRGRPLLQSIASSTEKSCEAAKIILTKDLNKIPSLANKCDFTQYGEGFERNILYTLTGLANTWTKDISPLMKNFSIKNENHKLLLVAQEKALLNAYGPGGRAAARAVVRRLSKLSPENFIQNIEKPMYTYKHINLTTYTTRMKTKQNIIAQKLTEPLKSEFKKEGSIVCIE